MATPGSTEWQGGEEGVGPGCCLGHLGMSAFPYNILLAFHVFLDSGELHEILWNKKIPLKRSLCASDEINVVPGSVPFLFLIHLFPLNPLAESVLTHPFLNPKPILPMLGITWD